MSSIWTSFWRYWRDHFSNLLHSNIFIETYIFCRMPKRRNLKVKLKKVEDAYEDFVFILHSDYLDTDSIDEGAYLMVVGYIAKSIQKKKNRIFLCQQFGRNSEWIFQISSNRWFKERSLPNQNSLLPFCINLSIYYPRWRFGKRIFTSAASTGAPT